MSQDDSTLPPLPLNTEDLLPPAIPPAVFLTAGEKPGDFIGPYKLLSEIGSGGFGVVWLAERREPMVQRVALKIIKPGMDSRAVIARFEQERQALAVMDHPNVAKVFDGGVTPTGRPYFAMEHVKGEPVTDFCDRHRLTIRQRLELFATVCEAVQHAHMKGIIHRDIKPSNILLASGDGGGGPVVKVIDFGVAKAISHTLTEKTIFTERGQIIGTPEYMSPEQAEMGATDIDTRTDVYSLGVVLYELLCGTLPFDGKSLRAAGYGEIQRIIREVDAPRPSTKLSTADDKTGAAIASARQADRGRIATELRRELEWIPLKALRKDRARRYASAESLAADVRRYLDSKPLEAAPESRAYLLRKFVRRNQVQVISLAAVGITLVAGFGTALWQAREASRQRDAAVLAKQNEAQQRAEAERERLRGERESYVGNVNAADAALSTDTPSRLRARLDACPEKYRGWEWRYLDAQSDRSLMVLRGHTGKVHGIAFDGAGRRLASASEDMTARVWDAGSGSQITVVRGGSTVRSVALDDAGKVLVTGTDAGTLSLWDAESGQMIATDRGRGGIQALALTPDGDRVVVARLPGGFQVFDVAARTWSSMIPAKVGIGTAISLTVDGRKLAACGAEGQCEVWDLKTQSLTVRVGESLDTALPPRIDCAGSRVLGTIMNGTVVAVWDVKTGVELARLPHGQRVRSAEFNHTGDLIVTSCEDGSARAWEASSGRLARSEHFGATVFASSFAPDGRTVLSLVYNSAARVWSIDGAPGSAVLRGHTDWLRSGKVAAGNRVAATSSNDGTIRLWALDSGPDVPALSEVAPRAGGYQIRQTSDDSIEVREQEQGCVLAKIKRYENGALQGRAGRQARPVSGVGWQRGVVLTGGGLPDAVLRGHAGIVSTVAFNPSGERVLTASDDATVRVWDAENGMELLCLRHESRVAAAVFSGTGELVVTLDEDGVVRIWDSVPLRARRMSAGLSGRDGKGLP